MKKILAGILVLTLVACLGTTISFAAGSVRGHHFEDINLDGICDNYTYKDGICDNYGVDCIAGRRGCGSYRDADGDGICDSCGFDCIAGRRGCGSYRDADGDGICDNCGADCIAGGAGCGNYIDADGDGVCDYYGGRGGCRSGAGCGRGCR